MTSLIVNGPPVDLAAAAAGMVGRNVYITYPNGAGGGGLIIGWGSDQDEKVWVYTDYGYALQLMEGVGVEENE